MSYTGILLHDRRFTKLRSCSMQSPLEMCLVLLLYCQRYCCDICSYFQSNTLLFCISQQQLFVVDFGSNMLVSICFKEVTKSKTVTKIFMCNTKKKSNRRKCFLECTYVYICVHASEGGEMYQGVWSAMHLPGISSPSQNGFEMCTGGTKHKLLQSLILCV